MRWGEALIAGAAFALCVIGLAALLLLAPSFTRIAASRLDVASEAALSAPLALSTAEEVRAFVAGSRATLPARVDGRDGFDAAAVVHLRDVRGVLASARRAVVVLAVLLAAWLTGAVVRRRPRPVADGLALGAVLCLVIPLAAFAAAAVDFDAFFIAFHRLFFNAGTWTFPSDALLIQLFPEAFWVSAGVAWAALVALGAATLALCSHVVRRRVHGVSRASSAEDA